MLLQVIITLLQCHQTSFIKCPLTSTCIQQLCSLDETQVTGPGPQSLGLPKAEPGVEVVCLQALLPINGVVATGIVWAVHPNLHKKKTFWITLAAKFWQEERNLTKNQHKINLFTVALFYSVPVKSDGLWHMFAHSPHQDASLPVGLWSLGWLWWLSLLVGSSRRKWGEFHFKTPLTNSFSALVLWPQWASHKWVLPVSDQYLQCPTPWVEDSVALLFPLASPWGTQKRQACQSFCCCPPAASRD